MITEFQKPAKRDLYNGCQFENGTLLESDLGLAALVNSSLDPIASGVLYQGNNVGPGSAPPAIPASQLKDIEKQLNELRDASAGLPKPSPNQSITDIANLLQDKSQLNSLIQKFQIPNEMISKSENQFKSENQTEPPGVKSVKNILVYADEANREEKRTQSIINNIVKPLYGIASNSLDPPCMKEATQDQFEAIAWSAKVSLAVIDVDKATTDDDATTALRIVEVG